VGEAALVLHGEGQAGQAAQPPHRLLQDVRSDQVGLDDRLGVQVVDERAVGADREPSMPYGSGHGVNPAGRTPGHEDERPAGPFDPREGGGRAGGDGAVAAQGGAVEVGGDEAGEGHVMFQFAP
jgi:hypothetical protein